MQECTNRFLTKRAENKYLLNCVPQIFIYSCRERFSLLLASCDVICKLISGISSLDLTSYNACFSLQWIHLVKTRNCWCFRLATRTTRWKKLEMASNGKTRKLLILIYIWRFLHKVGRASLLNTSLRHTLLKQISISTLNSTSWILFDIITVETGNAIKLKYNLRYK